MANGAGEIIALGGAPVLLLADEVQRPARQIDPVARGQPDRLADPPGVDERAVAGSRVVQIAPAPGVDQEGAMPARDERVFQDDVVAREPAHRVEADPEPVAAASLAVNEEVARAGQELLRPGQQVGRPVVPLRRPVACLFSRPRQDAPVVQQGRAGAAVILTTGKFAQVTAAQEWVRHGKPPAVLLAGEGSLA
jgi:hypothetical protein